MAHTWVLCGSLLGQLPFPSPLEELCYLSYSSKASWSDFIHPSPIIVLHESVSWGQGTVSGKGGSRGRRGGPRTAATEPGSHERHVGRARGAFLGVPGLVGEFPSKCFLRTLMDYFSPKMVSCRRRALTAPSLRVLLKCFWSLRHSWPCTNPHSQHSARPDTAPSTSTYLPNLIPEIVLSL